MSVRRDNPELLLAQYKAFIRQIPLLYFNLLANTLALAWSFHSLAPAWVAIWFPAFLILLSVARLVAWLRMRDVVATPELAWRALTRTNRLAGVMAVMFSLWAISLYPYGGPYEQAHIAFYMAITVVACIFCLMHLRPAAVTVTIVVNAVFVVFFGLSGQPTFILTSLNVALVSVAMLAVLMVYYRDFTDVVAARAENFRLANRDSLTGLPNRRSFFARLESEYHLASDGGYRLAMGIVDLDGFKPVNDLYGHAAGDELLVEVGARLRAACGDGVFVARLGGDEFAILAARVTGDAAISALGGRICEALRAPFVLRAATVQISASAGFAIYPDLASDSAGLFERADYALYHCKRNSAGAAMLFSIDHDAEIHRDLRIEHTLHNANLERELDVFFQPIINIETGNITSFEALARWKSPLLGQVRPDQFIPVAERAGIIDRLTRILLQKALREAVCWPDHIRLSFNLSAKDISSVEGALRLVAIIGNSGFDCRRLDFEITETAMLNDTGHGQAAIEKLRAIGCGISLDDFGTGYSSLTRLHSLPLTRIKIDRSFVTDLHIRPAGYKIVKSLLALSRDMELGCIVEGVETAGELEALRALGCVLVQGYYFSKPLSAADTRNFIAGNSGDQQQKMA